MQEFKNMDAASIATTAKPSQLLQSIRKKGWSQSNIALRLGVNQSTVSRIMKGSRTSNIDLRMKIALLFIHVNK